MKPLLHTATAIAVCFVADVAHACPVCFSANERNRAAYFITFVILTLLPLTAIGSVLLWLRKRTSAS